MMLNGKMMWLAALLAMVAGAACGSSAKSDNNGTGGTGGTGATGGTGGTGGAGGAGGAGGTGGTGGSTVKLGGLLGDGSPESVQLVVIANADDGLSTPRDLSFHPGRVGEAWIVSRGDDSTTIVFDATGAAKNKEYRRDGFAEHFMEEVSSIDFGAENYREDYTFGTCQESENTYDGAATPNFFMGPALWTSHLDVYAINDPIGLGSHLDMLHESPNCMGIAHEVDNVYWIFDGYHHKIARYDFQEDHDAGFDDHSDGLIRFLGEPRVTRVPDVPSHLFFDKATALLYVADTGNARVLRVDTASGELFRVRARAKEAGTVVEDWQGVVWDEVVSADAALLELPSGIAMHDGVLYVGDNATGEILAFDLEGNLVNRLATGAAPGGLMGLEVGPDAKLYFVDALANTVTRIEP